MHDVFQCPLLALEAVQLPPDMFHQIGVGDWVNSSALALGALEVFQLLPGSRNIICNGLGGSQPSGCPGTSPSRSRSTRLPTPQPPCAILPPPLAYTPCPGPSGHIRTCLW